jgi:hypothetical protein
MEQDLEQIPEIARLNVLPHGRLTRCPGCGNPSRKLPRWLLLFLGMQNIAFRVSHCDGGLDPQVRMQTPLGEVEATRVCAGIPHEHLHVVCTLCGTHLLMETYRGRK